MRYFFVVPVLFAILLCYSNAIVYGSDTWVEASFEDFRDGTFDASGQNLFVSAQGRVRTIHRFDLNQDGHLDHGAGCFRRRGEDPFGKTDKDRFHIEQGSGGTGFLVAAFNVGIGYATLRPSTVCHDHGNNVPPGCTVPGDRAGHEFIVIVVGTDKHDRGGHGKILHMVEG